VVVPLSGHISQGVVKFDIENFSDAIFLSPSIYYASLDIYAKACFYKRNQDPGWYLPVLECFVEKTGIQKVPKTTLTYKCKLDLGEMEDEMEWRVEDPKMVHVKCLRLRRNENAFC